MTLKHGFQSAAEQQSSLIGFVWRPEEITPAVIQMAQRTGSRAVFDFSMMGVDGLRSFLRKADTVGHVRDIRISASTFFDPSLGQLLKETGVQDIWVECHPQFFQGDPTIFLQRMRELSETSRCFPITGDTDLMAAIIKDGSGIGRIVLKGCEASGFVSSETATTLYAMLKEMLPTPAKNIDILIWGGVATPEAAAAFLSTGAVGIVFESVHWLTDMVAIDDVQRKRLANIRLDSTDLVGLDLLAPCRLFNKGNSLAFKEMKALEDSLYRAEIKDKSRRSFVSQVKARSLHPLESHFGQDEVIQLGVEASFAAPFAERFGTLTEEAIIAFMDEIRSVCGLAETKMDCFLDSPVAREMGTHYPFIQGAMSWITDLPEFASKIADAGGLPTFALGLMDAEVLDRKLGRLPEIMGERPYAVNVVSLAENPFRETHLAWIKKQKPRFVVIAGGDLSPIQQLLECGLEVIFIAPDEALLRLALEAGVRYVICEGYEAGGHVGQHSTLTLAQMVLVLKRRMPALFQNAHLILAGGIFNRETAFMAAMLGAEAIQMGTAYLATQEVVASGALTALYQRMILQSPPGGTVVSGKDTGLRVRSLRTPRVEAIVSLEKKFAAGHKDEASFRAKMEEIAAGSLYAAARGMDKSGKVVLDEQVCLERGQFMSGACAGLIRTVWSLTSLHRELAESPLLLHHSCAWEIGRRPKPSPVVSSPQRTARSSGEAHERIAITGMSILNSLGKSPEEVWDASLAMQSGITLIPPSRWDHRLYYDPRPRALDKTFCSVGAFLDFPVSRNELGIPPQDFRSMTSSTKYTMWMADKAIRASGILESEIPRERIGVIVSQNSGEAAGTLTNIIIRAYVHDILASVNRAVHLTPHQLNAIEGELKAGRIAPDDTTLLGRLNCAAPGFICNRYGFKGPSYAVSAACATSLVALYSALQLIRNGIIDAAIVGGGEEDLTHLHYLEFSALGALYGISGRERPAHETSRPFDLERDGLVLGEGGGMIVIERESLARARGAGIHAIITGMGASNSHLGMVESASVAQELAIRASFRDVPYGPDVVDLVECHATSTRQGDVEEVRALKTFFKPSKRTVLTSFKSQIGHTLGASGINNLIRGTMAMKAGVFPATLNYGHPDPEMGLTGSGFLIAREPFDWKCRAGEPRRLQVNAFGFGGSNYVVQVEQAMDEADAVFVATGSEAVFHREQCEGLPTIPGVSCFSTEMDGHGCRLAVVAHSEEEALRVIAGSADLAEAGSVSSKAERSLAQQGVFLRRANLPVLPLAFVFPGQGSQYQGMGQDLYESVPVFKEWMDRAAAAADFDLLQLMFRDQEENLQKTRWQQPALFAMEHALARYFTSLGVKPVAMAGHSLGELTALCLADVFSVEDGFRIVNMRAICMDKAAAMNLDPGVMAATDAPLELLETMIKGQENVHISNINSPQQVVLGGATGGIRNFAGRLRELGYRTTFLRVSMAFHTPIMKVIHAELEAYVAAIPFYPPRIPVISNTTMAPYPSDPAAIKQILMSHLESPVHWMNNARALWNDYGTRLFLEIGPGASLSNLIIDTLAEPACIQTCLPAEEFVTCKTALARLFVQGHLQVAEEPQFISLSGISKPDDAHSGPPVAAPAEPVPPRKGQALSASGETSAAHDLLERLIHIIMEATGFERDEIKPEMDLRRDLSIRSSRLPIIMDAAEREFGITIEMEDFIDVRTVQDIALRIATILAAQGGAGLQPTDPPKVGGAKAPGDDLMETLIAIIMEATGFERDEIMPEMDLRRDLSIRSSRLPIIMDAAERQFGITIEMEDFIDVRTVHDIAVRIATLLAAQGSSGLQPEGDAVSPAALKKDMNGTGGDMASLKRLVFSYTPVALTASQPIQVNSGETVLFLSPDSNDRIVVNAGDILRLDHGVKTVHVRYMQGNCDQGEEWYDLLSDEGSGNAAARIPALTSLAGMIITLPHSGSGLAGGVADAARLLRGLFLQLKAFLKSPAKKFVVLIHPGGGADIQSRLLAEGLLGLFLSGAQEYSSVQFRSLEVEKDADVRSALRDALDRGCPAVELVHRDGQVFTSAGKVALSAFKDSSGISLNPGDVVVMSGGATGISAHLARSLAPFEPRLIFLGRTLPGAGNERSTEIAQTLEDLHSAGIEASYHACDVTDPVAVKAVMVGVAKQYGRIDGIIHGAGVLRDALLQQMTGDDFSTVLDVKLLGAWNLFSAADGAGLRFFVGLSSIAAIQGNPGQGNYAAANRMLSALCSSLRRTNENICFKALLLPPVEGAGMADTPEIRKYLQQKGVAYIQTDELAGLFCRELFVSPADDVRVMFMKSLPAITTGPSLDTTAPSLSGELSGGTVSLRPGDFPLIERITSLDLHRETLEAVRTFSREKDLWIADHRPFTFIKHPLVSAIMVLETFMEAARILYPHLQVRGVRQVRFMEMIQCPPGVPRPVTISCLRAGTALREVVCDLSLSAAELTPVGRLTDRITPHYQGQVILAGDGGMSGEGFGDFPVRPDELRIGPMDYKQVLAWYKEQSGLEGRYRVMESLDGAGPGSVRGRTIYREGADFAGLQNASYQYSPYLFEAVLQLAAFYLAASDPAERRSLIPLEIGEMRFARKCRPGEQITVEARLRSQDDEILVWDARGVDVQGVTVMQVRTLRMHWVVE